MPELIWNQIDSHRYESGISHGVLYPLDGPGVVWNGLISIEESYLGGEVESLYFDGNKYMNMSSNRNYKAKIQAYSAPPEFGPCVGEQLFMPGFIVTRQPRERFSFSYRSEINDGPEYKIHLVYNALARFSQRGYATIAESMEPSLLSWDVDAVPVITDTHKGSAHYVVHSSKTDPLLLEVLENKLYGTSITDPTMPSFNELFDILDINSSLITEPLTEPI